MICSERRWVRGADDGAEKIVTVSLVGISGSTRRPSRTTVLVGALVQAVADRLVIEPHIIELANAAPSLFATLRRDEASAAAEALIDRVERADLLVVATPVYRGSYTGALKHLFDLIDHRALAGTPVVLAATGGSALHGLVTEHQLRPLLGFFRALSLPTAVYATEADFADGVITSTAVLDHIERAADELAELVAGGPRLCAVSLTHRRHAPAGIRTPF